MSNDKDKIERLNKRIWQLETKIDQDMSELTPNVGQLREMALDINKTNSLNALKGNKVKTNIFFKAFYTMVRIVHKNYLERIVFELENKE